LSRNQKLVLLIGSTFILISGIFPPWAHIYLQGKDSFENDAGRHFIFDKPESLTFYLRNNIEITSRPQIDINRLFLEWLLVVATAGILILFLADAQTAKKTAAPFDRRFPGSFLIALFVTGLYIYWFPMQGLGSAPAFLIFITLPMMLALLILLFFDVFLNTLRRGFRWMKALLLIEGLLFLSFSVWWVLRFLKYMRM
jgi:hypothetical protein